MFRKMLEERRVNKLCIAHSKIVAPSYDKVVTIQIQMADLEMKRKCLEHLEAIIQKKNAVVRHRAANFITIECPNVCTAKALKKVYG